MGTSKKSYLTNVKQQISIPFLLFDEFGKSVLLIYETV